MEEKPWRTNMKKAGAKREREDDDEKEEDEEEETKSDKNDDELTKRPWRNNMRETSGKSAEGKRHSFHHTLRIMLSGDSSFEKWKVVLPLHFPLQILFFSPCLKPRARRLYLYLSPKFQPRPPRALKSIGNGRPRRRRG